MTPDGCGKVQAADQQTMIDVLLATYNGEAFLSEQIESVLAQEGVRLRILARDDGSTDGTTAILDKLEKAYPKQIAIQRFSVRLGGPGNFAWLLDQARSPYVAFCDQDDIWKSHKLRTLLARMQTLEQQLGHDTPILVHSDLNVVDRVLKPIHPSFWAYSGIDPTRTHVSQVLIKNPVTGCALLANRALLERARPIPEEAVMHDHWLALVASVFGHIEAVEEPLVLYRQHGRNTVGAEAYGWKANIRRLLSGCGRKNIPRLRRQAGGFLARFKAQLRPAQVSLIRGFTKLSERGWVGRRMFLLRHGILLPGVARNLALLFCARLAMTEPERVNRRKH